MSLRCWLLFVIAGFAAVGAGADEAAQTPAEVPKSEAKNSGAPKSEPQKFIRLERSAAGAAITLQTVIVELKATRPEESGLTVDLVGAIHIAEKGYYEALNEAFKAYDVVLYEMVAPAGASVPRGPQRSSHPVMVLQNAFKDMLGLEHQLEIVDYSKQNLVHADMSPTAFAKSMQDRHESIWDILFRSLQLGLSKRDAVIKMGPGSDIELLWALFDKRQSAVLKRYLAEPFAGVDELATMLDGPQGSTIISERNKVALEELKRQIAGGKKHIAIFYGAAHLPDMQRRLIADFAMQPGGERWLTAWNMPEAPRNAAAPAKKRRAKKNDPPAEKHADS